MSYLLLIVPCLYNPGILCIAHCYHFEGGYYYAHLGAAYGGYTTILGAARIQANTVLV